MNLKLWVLVSVLFISGLNVFSQSPFRVFTTRADQNQASTDDVPGSVEITRDGGFMSVTWNDGASISILKFSSTGALQWCTDFGPAEGRCGVQLSDSTYVAVGNNGSNMMVIKTDKNGTLLWSRTYSSSSQANYVQQTLDGGLMIGGIDGPTWHNTVLVKTDINGNVQWSKQYSYNGGNTHLMVHKGVQLADSSYVMGCSGGNGMVLFKTDKNGNLKWTNEYSLQGVLSYTLGLRKTRDNGFIMTGTDNYEYWHVMKTDSAGIVQWSNRYNPPGWTTQGACYDVEELDYGYACVGMYYDNIGFSASYLMKTDPNGNVLWSRYFDEPYWNEMHSVKQTADKGLVMWGRAQIVGSAERGDLIKTDSSGLGACGDSIGNMIGVTFNTTVSTPSISVSVVTTTFTAISNSFSGAVAVESFPCDVPPKANFSASDTSVCVGSSVTFNDLSGNGPTGWSWTFNKGTPGHSTSQNPTITYDTVGTFPVKLVVTNSYGADSLTKTGYITVTASPAPGTITANPDSVCPGGNCVLSVTGTSGALQWQSSNGGSYTNISGANNASYNTPSLTQSTSYRLIAGTGLCIDTSLPVVIKVIAMPVAGVISASPDSVCAGNSSVLSVSGNTGIVQWQDSITGSGFANISGADSVIYTTAALVQTTSYRVIVQNGICSDTSSSRSVVVFQSAAVPGLYTTDSLICSSDSTQIYATTGYTTYLWNDNDTTGYTYARNAGDYWVTVTNALGCTAVSGHQYIATYPTPSVSITEVGDTLSSLNALAYQWYFNGSIIQGATGPVYIANQTGNYSVQITDTNGCLTRSSDTYVSTGITGPDVMGSLNIYPDPFNNTILISGNNGAIRIDRLDIYNVFGENVVSKEVSGVSLSPNLSLDVSFLPTGVYILEVKAGNMNYLKKMTKE